MIKELGYLKEAEIKVAAEDSILYDSPFMGRFGLSLLLDLKSEHEQKKILFDTNSAPGPVLYNLEIYGVPLEEITTIFLSHCHCDHTDGLYGVLEAMPHPVPVVAHPEIFRSCFEINPSGLRHIGITDHSREEYERLGAIFTLTREPLNLMEGVVTAGEIERATSFEQLEDLFTTQDGKVVQDHERDDTAVVLNFREGLVIITGCAHSGIVNTMIQAKKVTGVDKVHAVIGGLHLIDGDEEKKELTVEALEEVDFVLAGHCTGFDGLRRIANAIGDRFCPLKTGMILHLPFHKDRPLYSRVPKHVIDRYRGAP